MILWNIISDTNVKGLNPATGTARDKKVLQHLSRYFKNDLQLYLNVLQVVFNILKVVLNI
jgi:hypothetical protein